MNRKERITLTDTGVDAVAKLSEGNPGALHVCCQLVKEGAAIDPDDAFAGIGKLLSLDTLGIYGSRIWLLYKDVCGQNLAKVIALMRAVQLGLLAERILLDAIEHHGQGLDVSETIKAVKTKLPSFDPQNLCAKEA